MTAIPPIVPRTERALASLLREELKTLESCRIEQDVLMVCFSPNKRAPYADQILAFAAKHGWLVAIHAPAKLGVVADFSPSGPPRR
jgi:hypothetical protein